MVNMLFSLFENLGRLRVFAIVSRRICTGGYGKINTTKDNFDLIHIHNRGVLLANLATDNKAHILASKPVLQKQL